jgi:GrpB-like predicted nucleotidyltransferase (UPF0157 family)
VDEPAVELTDVAEVRPVADRIVDAFRRDVSGVVPDADVEHVGATALPGGTTKGDVDVSLRVAPERFAAAVAALRTRYEVAQPENWTATFASFSAPGYELPLGIQVAARGSADDFLVALRDRMRAEPELARAYDEVKRGAAGAGPEAYWAAKDAFLKAVLGADAE